MRPWGTEGRGGLNEVLNQLPTPGNNLSGVAVQFATQFWANATQ